MQWESIQAKLPRPEVLGLLFILVLSFFTIFYGYQTPQHFFWDENYHVASAQKYLNGTFFMEPHPPLGKMLIALGEKVLHRNAENNQFIGTDYAQNPPEGFSFTGYRFFPVILAWLTAPLLFCIFFVLTGRSLWSIFLSFLYVFDNALIVHLRGAMLEGPLLFFSVLTILAFLLCTRKHADRTAFAWSSFLFGFAFAGVMLTKVFGLVLVLLVPALVLLLRKNRGAFRRFLLWSAVGFLPFYILIWQLHFAIASNVNPILPDGGTYQASATYKKILSSHTTTSLLSFPVMWRDSVKFVSHYEAGVPVLNLCKKDENGSPWFLWPFGGRAINYRWETPNGDAYRYLYLQANPAIWMLGLVGIVGGGALLLCSVFAPLKDPLRSRGLLLTFFSVYVSYMIAISTITRVMYLYHYFIPLIVSFILFALVMTECTAFGHIRLKEVQRTASLLIIGLLIFVSYQFYRPLTYYEPITDSQFQKRVLLRIWDLHCVRCSTDSLFTGRGNNTQ